MGTAECVPFHGGGGGLKHLCGNERGREGRGGGDKKKNLWGESA